MLPLNETFFLEKEAYILSSIPECGKLWYTLSCVCFIAKLFYYLPLVLFSLWQ